MLITIGFVLSVFLTCSSNNGRENLIKYDNNGDGIVSYYDKNSIKRKSGTVQVWEEERYNTYESLRKQIDRCNGDYEQQNKCDRLLFSKVLWEIDCEQNKVRLLISNIYDKNENILFHSSYHYSEAREYIIPNTVMDKLKNCVCK
jgi:hypothetical protein